MGLAEIGIRLRPYAAAIAEIASAVQRRIAIEQLPVVAAFRNTYPVLFAGHRREIADEEKKISRVLCPPEKANDTVLPIVKINPM